MTTTKTVAKIKAGKVTTEEIKPKALEVVDNELVVFGNKISRHPKFPWLFRVTDVHKACVKPIKQTAIKKGKDPESAFRAKAPSQFFKNNTKPALIKEVAKNVRKRIKKHGLTCGLGDEVEVSKSTMTRITVLTDREMCIQSINGGDAAAGVLGTYVCQDLLISYAAFLNATFHAKMLNSFTALLNGYVEEVIEEVEDNSRKAKGTPERATNIVSNNKLNEVCARHGIPSRPVQGEINRSVLRMPKKEYMKKHKLSEPINDNLPVSLVVQKNFAIGITTAKLFSATKVTTVQAKAIAYDSGVLARYFFNNLDRLGDEAKSAEADEESGDEQDEE